MKNLIKEIIGKVKILSMTNEETWCRDLLPSEKKYLIKKLKIKEYEQS